MRFPLRSGLPLALLLAALHAPALADAPAVSTWIVQLAHPPGPAERAGLAAHGVMLEELRVIDGGIARMTGEQAAALRAEPYVLRVDPDERLEPALDLSRALVRMEPFHERGDGPTGRGVTIAVLDGWLDSTHPDFEGRVRANLLWDGSAWRPNAADPDGHGTHVAGVAAGSGAGSEGELAGFAPQAGLAFLGFGNEFTTTVALRAFDWIYDNHEELDIRVVTNSWGRAEGDRRFDPEDGLVLASDRLVREGVVVVFAATNHGPAASTVALEAQNPNVVTVGAVDDAAVVAPFSSRGPVLLANGTLAGWVKPDLVADGVAVAAARSAAAAPPVGGPLAPPLYEEMQGTSQAAPAVAGVVAAMLEENPRLTPREVKRILLETAVDLGEPGPDDATGFGLLDARDALALARGLPADRGNVLLAGGEDVFVSQGEVVATGAAAIQIAPQPAVREGGLAEAVVPVKPGARRVAFDFAWTGEARVAVYLHDGSGTRGPWTRESADGARRVVSGAVDDPVPGVWRLLARPAGSDPIEYVASARVALSACETCASVADPRYLDAAAGATVADQAAYWLEDASEDAALWFRKAAEGPGEERTVALLALGLVGLAAALRFART